MKAKRGTTQGGRFTIREAGKPEPKRFDKLLEEKHPQQKPKRVGHELRMIVEEDRVGLVRNHWAGVENRLHWRKDAACVRTTP